MGDPIPYVPNKCGGGECAACTEKQTKGEGTRLLRSFVSIILHFPTPFAPIPFFHALTRPPSTHSLTTHPPSIHSLTHSSSILHSFIHSPLAPHPPSIHSLTRRLHRRQDCSHLLQHHGRQVRCVHDHASRSHSANEISLTPSFLLSSHTSLMPSPLTPPIPLSYSSSSSLHAPPISHSHVFVTTRIPSPVAPSPSRWTCRISRWATSSTSTPTKVTCVYKGLNRVLHIC
jgi:hypothetical protein